MMFRQNRFNRRFTAGLALLIAIAVVVVIVLVTASSTPNAARASSQPSGSTTVQRRNLVATDTESGTLSYRNPETVYDRLTGTITWLPAVGQVINQGQALFRVNGLPVILMHGTTPAYRDLNASDSNGPDILELNRDLIALGYTSEGIIVDDVWQPATTAAVEVLQESLGETVTGSLSLGQVVFLPGSQVVSTVDATLGGNGSGSGGGAGASFSGRQAPEFVSLTTTTPTSGTGQAQPPMSKKHHRRSGGAHPATSLAALIALLRAEMAELRAENAQLRAANRSGSSQGGGGPNGGGGAKGNSGGSPSGSAGAGSGGGGSAGGGSPGSGGGSGGGNAMAVLQTASTQLVATVDLDASKQSEAKVGEKVTVQMPAGNTVDGTVIAVSPVAQSSSNSGNGNGGGSGSGNGNGNGNGNGSSGATIPVTVALRGHPSGVGLDQAAVSVNFVQSVANDVLSVPVTALLATAGGGYAVQAATSPHHLIPVTTGLFAAGYVQVSGPGIYPGLAVTDSQG